MIGGGVTFQPGSQDEKKINPNAPQGTQEGVQEAIKVLSLRLPKVVGANAPVPTPLLTAPGAQGNSRVDSIVAQVMQKYFPTEAPAQPQAPSVPSAQMEAPPMRQAQPQRAEPSYAPQFTQIPKIIVGTPPEAPMFGGPAHPGAPTWDGGGSPQFGNVAPLPDLKQLLDWVPPPSDIPMI